MTKNKPYDEVLGAAQFTERTMHAPMSKVVKSCHKLSYLDFGHLHNTLRNRHAEPLKTLKTN